MVAPETRHYRAGGVTPPPTILERERPRREPGPQEKYHAMSLINERASARNKISDDATSTDWSGVVRADLVGADTAVAFAPTRRPAGRDGHALRRSPNGAPASLIGAVVDELHATEKAS